MMGGWIKVSTEPLSKVFYKLYSYLRTHSPVIIFNMPVFLNYRLLSLISPFLRWGSGVGRTNCMASSVMGMMYREMEFEYLASRVGFFQVNIPASPFPAPTIHALS